MSRIVISASSALFPLAAASARPFIAIWRDREGGAEHADYALFLTKLTDLLSLPNPEPAGATTANNDYVFVLAAAQRKTRSSGGGLSG